MNSLPWTWTLSVAILLSANIGLIAATASDGHKGECDRYSVPNS